VTDYDPAQLRVMADEFIGPWLILKAKERIAARKTVNTLCGQFGQSSEVSQ
jgi:hypothetical protein